MRWGIGCVSSSRLSWVENSGRHDSGGAAFSANPARIRAGCCLSEAPLGCAPSRSRGPLPMSDEILQYRFQNLHEFVKVARQNLDRNNWDYLIGASESETTLARNRLAPDSLGFRPRVLRDVSNVDCTRTLFGRKLRLPVLCAPVGSLQNFDPGGGGTVAAATAGFGNGMILSSVSDPGMDKTAEAAGDGFRIFQLYVRGDRSEERR